MGCTPVDLNNKCFEYKRSEFRLVRISPYPLYNLLVYSVYIKCYGFLSFKRKPRPILKKIFLYAAKDYNL